MKGIIAIIITAVLLTSCGIRQMIACAKKRKQNFDFLVGTWDNGAPKKYKKQNIKRNRQGRTCQWAKR